MRVDTKLRKPFDQKPVFGRLSLFVVLGLFAVIALLMGQNWSSATDVALWVGIGTLILGILCATISLVRRERPRWAIATLVLLVASPLIAFLVGLLVLMFYGLVLGTG